jgi:hypothetical protein
VSLITGESRFLEPVRDERANLAAVLRLRELPAARPRLPFLEKLGRAGANRRETAYAGSGT